MSTLSKLFSGYTGGGNHIAKNGKFSTTKNNHNRNKYGRPTVNGSFSHKYLKLWFGDDYKNVVKEAKDYISPNAYIYSYCIASDNTNLPSYMNPIYHLAFHQPKRAYK